MTIELLTEVGDAGVLLSPSFSVLLSVVLADELLLLGLAA